MKNLLLLTIQNEETVMLVFFIAGGILLFIILREFFCWYFKINKRIALMEEQNLYLKDLTRNTTKKEPYKFDNKKLITT